MENNWMNLMNLLSKTLTSKEIVYHLKNKNIFNELAKERSSEFKNMEKNNSDNLIYACKNEGINPKDFTNYQNPIELFKNLI